MKKYQFFAICLMAVLTGFYFLSCSSDDDKNDESKGSSAIVGTWVSGTGNYIMKYVTDPAEKYLDKYVFEKNGRFEYISKSYSTGPNYTNIEWYVTSYEGSYSVDENKNGMFLYLNFDDGRCWTRLIVSITQTNLTYMDVSDGETITWTKFNY